MRLFHLTYRKLAPGGVFIAETINPMCLLALASNYTLDLSHQQPVHPDTAAFIAEAAGFADVAVRYTSPVADSSKLQLLEPAESATAEPWRIGSTRTYRNSMSSCLPTKTTRSLRASPARRAVNREPGYEIFTRTASHLHLRRTSALRSRGL